MIHRKIAARVFIDLSEYGGLPLLMRMKVCITKHYMKTDLEDMALSNLIYITEEGIQQIPLPTFPMAVNVWKHPRRQAF